MQKHYGSKVEPVTFSVPVKEDLAARMLRVFQRGELAIPNDAMYLTRPLLSLSGYISPCLSMKDSALR